MSKVVCSSLPKKRNICVIQACGGSGIQHHLRALAWHPADLSKGVLAYCPRRNYYWINSGKGGSSNSWDSFTGIHSFQTDTSNLILQEEQSRKWLEMIINSCQGLSRNKISNFSDINCWRHFSGSAIILVATVWDARGGGSYSWKGVFLPSKCDLESTFLEPLSKPPPKPADCKTASKNPS